MQLNFSSFGYKENLVQMFSLLEFKNHKLSVTKSKNVENIVGDTCTVKYCKRKYPAFLVSTSDDKAELLNLVKKKEKESQKRNSKRAKLFGNSNASSNTTTNKNLNNSPEEIHYPDPNDVVVEIHDSQVVFKNLNKKQLARFKSSLLDQIENFKSTTSSQNELLPISTTNNCENNINKRNSSALNPANENISSVDVTDYNLDCSGKIVTEKANNITEVDGPLDINQIFVPYSKINPKKHFCIFCKKLQTKISRHLYLQHKNEYEVKRALALPKKCLERMKIMNNIRKRGDFEHNTSAKHNTGVLIVSRQQQSKRKNLVDDYVCCKICKGFFSKNTIRIHNSRCGIEKGYRSTGIDSRRLTQYIHTAANNVLKTKIFPVLRVDQITKAIRYDELVIKFGNYLIETSYPIPQDDVIRHNLRLLGRFKIEMKKLDPTINELKEIYKSHLVDKCIMAIRNIANWNETWNEFEVPSVAQNLTSLIKNCGKRQRAELIKESRENLKREVENFLLLWDEEIPLINKIVFECQTNKKASLYRKNKRRRRNNSKSENISPISGDVSEIFSDNSSQCATVESLILPSGEIIPDYNADTKNISETSLNSGIVSDLISEGTQDLSPDMSEFVSENANRVKDDTINEVDVPLNINEMLVPYSKGSSKRHFCIFCKKLQTKISRHLYLQHKKEAEIKRALALPKNCPERMKIMNSIRKRGDFEHNTSSKYNTGVLIVSRQQQSKCNNMADDYVCCKTCMGFFSKRTIRSHKRSCEPSKNKRSNLIESRRLTQYIHTAANYDLKTKIFPGLRLDEVTKSIRYDELVIKFGNYLIEKCSAKNQNDVVRQNLRLLGRFKIEINKLDDTINELKDIYKSPLVDKCIMAIRNVAKWNESSADFEVPAVAENLTSLIKKCGKRHRAELIKEGKDDVKTQVENFLLLWEEEVNLVNKNDVEAESNQRTFSQRETKRCKWTDAEKEAVSLIFGDLGRLTKLPSLEECLNAIRQSQALSKRTAPQLKSWIDNQRRYKLA